MSRNARIDDLIVGRSRSGRYDLPGTEPHRYPPRAPEKRATMHERFQALVHGAILALIIGWVLYIGKPIFVPVVLSVLVVYVIVGLTRLLERIPVLGSALPVWLRYTLSIVVIALGLVAAFYEI